MESFSTSVLIAVAVIIAIVIVTVGYHAMPFRSLPRKKPKFQIYPKYGFRFHDRDAVLRNLERLGFESAGQPGLFARGTSWSDRTSQNPLVHVRLSAHKNQGVIYLPAAGALYDTGDLWDVAHDILKE